MKKDHKDILLCLIRRGLAGLSAEPHMCDSFSEEKMLKKRLSMEWGRRISLTPDEVASLRDLGLLEKSTALGYYKLTPAGSRKALDLLPPGEYEPLDLDLVLFRVFETDFFRTVEKFEEPAIPYIWKPGTSRLVLVLGENAGGKSFFRRLLMGATFKGERHASWGGKRVEGFKRPPGPYPVQEFLSISMQGRTQGGMGSSAVYGIEEWLSTGQNSAQTVTKGIETAEDRGHTCILYWDEPDLGMSGSAAAGVGLEIADWMRRGPHPLVQGIFITSHNKGLVRQCADLSPHYIYLGDKKGPASLEEWLSFEAPPLRPSELQERSRKRHSAIQKVINSQK